MSLDQALNGAVDWKRVYTPLNPSRTEWATGTREQIDRFLGGRLGAEITRRRAEGATVVAVWRWLYDEGVSVSSETVRRWCEFYGATRGGNQPCTLYRFYDADGRLLYVGISEEGPHRWQAHRNERPWWLQVVRATMEHFASRHDALVAELAAIQSEAPTHNKAGVA